MDSDRSITIFYRDGGVVEFPTCWDVEETDSILCFRFKKDSNVHRANFYLDSLAGYSVAV